MFGTSGINISFSDFQFAKLNFDPLKSGRNDQATTMPVTMPIGDSFMELFGSSFPNFSWFPTWAGICSVQKIINRNSNRTNYGGHEDLIKFRVFDQVWTL